MLFSCELCGERKKKKNTDVPANRSLHKLVFRLDLKKIEAKFHTEKGHIICRSLVYMKDGKLTGFQVVLLQISFFFFLELNIFSRVQHDSAEVSQQELMESFQLHLSQERECMQKLRDSERETAEILDVLAFLPPSHFPFLPSFSFVFRSVAGRRPRLS
jgi:hypothetical protein